MHSCYRSHLLLAVLLAVTLALAASAWAVPSNEPPTTPTSAVVSPATGASAVSDLQVVATGSTDPDGDAVTYRYQWQSKAPAGLWTDVPLATTDTLTHPLRRDHEYRALAWAVSGTPEQQSVNSWASNPVLVANTAPEAPAIATLSSLMAKRGTPLTATYAETADIDGDSPLIYSVQWSMSADAGATWTPWGHTGAAANPNAAGSVTLTGATPLKGQLWKARVLASDGTLTAVGIESNDTVEIVDSAPTFVESSSPAGFAQAMASVGHTDDVTARSALEAMAAFAQDVDGDAITYKYQWQERVWTQAGTGTWADISGETASTLSPPLIRGYEYRVLIWAVSGFPALESANSLASNAVVVNDTAPTAPASVTITPQLRFVTTDLTASYEAATDVDGDEPTYTVEWALSTDGGFTWGDWGNPGTLLTATTGTPAVARFSRGQTWRARAIASDGSLESVARVSASVVIGNSLPTTSTPVIAPSNPTSVDDLTVAAPTGADADAGDLANLTFRYQWARRTQDGVKTKGSAWGAWQDGGSTLPHTRLARGDEWKVQVTAFDGIDLGEPVESAPVQILNSLPTAPTAVTFGPAAPRSGQAITATADGATDLDGDTITYHYDWFLWDVATATFVKRVTDSAVLTATEDWPKNGQKWQVQAWANDGTGDGAKFTTDAQAPLVIGNAAPSAPTSVTLTPAKPRSIDKLTAVGAGSIDPEGSGVTYKFRWKKSTDGGSTWVWVANPGGATAAASLLKRGEVWKVESRAFDGAAYSPWAASEPVTILNTTPAIAKVKLGIAPAKTARTTDTLQGYASGATDTDGDDITYQFQWSVRGAEGDPWGKWGYTRQVLTGVTLVVGQQWRLRVRASDGHGWSAWNGTKTVTIVGAAPPPPTRVLISPADPVSSNDLTVTASGSGRGVTYSYQWASSTNGGSTWSAWGNPGRKIDHSLLQGGQTWKARARATLAGQSSGWVGSNVVTIGNAAPSAPVVTIAPLTPNPNQALTATATSTDADGDTVTYEYQWSRSTNGGTTWSGWSWTGAVLSADVTDLRDQWRVQARATDGTQTSDWVTSDWVTILGMFTAQDPQPNAAAGPRDCLSFTFRDKVSMASAQDHFSLTVGGTPVEGTEVWKTANLVMWFVPSQPLQKATVHTVTMASGTVLAGGGTYDWTETFNFTTGSAPVVTAATPRGSAVPTTSPVAITFDQYMKGTSTLAAFAIVPNVAGTAKLSGSKFTYTPTLGLKANTQYTVTMGKTAQSSSGLAMHADYSWSFTTGAAPPVGLSAAAARTAAGAQINVNLSAAADVSVVISNLAGRVVAQLPGRALPAGVSTLTWNGRSATGTTVPAGLYLVRVESNSLDGGRANCLTTLQQ